MKPRTDFWDRKYPEPVFLNIYGAQESIPRNEYRFVAWRAGTITLFLLGS